MNKFQHNPTRLNQKHPNESLRQYAEKRLMFLLEDLFLQATGQVMAADFRDYITGEVSDVVDAFSDAEDERSDRVY